MNRLGRFQCYHDCPCRDCFEIAIGAEPDDSPSLCHDCEEAGCDAEGKSECEAENAYGDETFEGDI